MGKSTIFNYRWQFSIAMFVYQRVTIKPCKSLEGHIPKTSPVLPSLAVSDPTCRMLAPALPRFAQRQKKHPGDMQIFNVAIRGTYDIYIYGIKAI
jgi:hypothetical protein